MASSWSFAKAMSSMVGAADAGTTSPTVSPAARRFGRAGERLVAEGAGAAGGAAVPIDMAAAGNGARRANSPRVPKGRKLYRAPVLAGPAGGGGWVCRVWGAGWWAAPRFGKGGCPPAGK